MVTMIVVMVALVVVTDHCTGQPLMVRVTLPLLLFSDLPSTGIPL